jgi:hypothetical protein
MILRSIEAEAHWGYLSWRHGLDEDTVKFLLRNPDIPAEDVETYCDRAFGGEDLSSRVGPLAF